MERTGFFNGEQQYGQEEFNRYFENLYENGISVNENGEMSFFVTKTSSGILIDTGFAIIKGFFLYNDTPKKFELTPDENYSRIDRVVIKLDLSHNSMSLEVKQGIPSSQATPPVLTRDHIVYELALATITITKDNVITIQDERFAPNMCGAIRPKNLSEFNTMMRTFHDRYEEWFAKLQPPTRNIFLQADIPSEPKEGDLWL